MRVHDSSNLRFARGASGGDARSNDGRLSTYNARKAMTVGYQPTNPYSHRLEVLFYWVLPGPIGGKRREEPRSPAT